MLIGLVAMLEGNLHCLGVLAAQKRPSVIAALCPAAPTAIRLSPHVLVLIRLIQSTADNAG